MKRTLKYFPFFILLGIIFINGCRKEDKPIGPFISVLEVNKYPINMSNFSFQTLTETSDSTIIFVLSSEDIPLRIIKFDQDLRPIYDNEIQIEITIGEIIENSEKEYMISCTQYAKSTNTCLKLVKLSYDGQLLWTREYFKENFNIVYGSTIKQFLDGTYFLTCRNGIDSLFTLKINENGDSIWSKSFSFSDNLFSHVSSYLDKNNHFIYNADQQLIEFNSNGMILWQTPFYNSDYLNSLFFVNNNEFFATGYNRFIQDHYYSNRFLLRKYSDSGSLIWSTTFIQDINGSGNSLFINNLNYIYIIGEESILLKTDFLGNLVYSSDLNGIISPSSGTYITEKDSIFYAYGIEGMNLPDSSKVYLVKFKEIK